MKQIGCLVLLPGGSTQYEYCLHTRFPCQDLLFPRFVLLCSRNSALNAEIDGQSPLEICLLCYVASVCFLRLPGTACEHGASRLKLAENSLVPEPTGEMRAYHVKMEKLGIYCSWREKSVS
jgi:hypothetical protein